MALVSASSSKSKVPYLPHHAHATNDHATNDRQSQRPTTNVNALDYNKVKRSSAKREAGGKNKRQGEREEDMSAPTLPDEPVSLEGKALETGASMIQVSRQSSRQASPVARRPVLDPDGRPASSLPRFRTLPRSNKSAPTSTPSTSTPTTPPVASRPTTTAATSTKVIPHLDPSPPLPAQSTQ